MRLFDQIASGKYSLHPNTKQDYPASECRRLRQTVADLVASSVRFDITNVSDYFICGEREHWDWNTDFPNSAPPFETFWMEARYPSSSTTSTGVVVNKQIRRVGTLWDAVAVESGWLLKGMLFGDVVGLGVHGPVVFFQADVDQHGGMSRSPTLFFADQHLSKTDDGVGAHFVAPMLAINFLHCRNVVTIDAPDRRSKSERRVDRRAGKEPVTMKEIVIDPMRRVLATEGQSERVGLQRALHICRGHFAHYSEERPLFGKHAGTFWKPAHVRGSEDAGRIEKSYRVKAPKGQAA